MGRKLALLSSVAVAGTLAATVAAMPGQPPAADFGQPFRAPREQVADIRPFVQPRADVADAMADALTRQPRQLPNQATTVMLDDFDGVEWPDRRLWILIEDLTRPPQAHGHYHWWPRDCRYRSFPRSLWAVGGGVDGENLQCASNYPNHALSVAMIDLDLRPFDDAGQLDLVFDYWLNLRDESMGGVEPDGLFVAYNQRQESGEYEPIIVDGITSVFPERFFDAPRRLDLGNLEEIYPPHRTFDVRGQRIFMQFIFKSSAEQATAMEGVFIDDLRIESDTAPEMTETPTPSQTPENGTSPTPTETPEEGTPPTPTETPEEGTPPTPTETPENGTPPTPTETPENGTPPTPTETPEDATPPTPTETQIEPRHGLVYLPLAYGRRDGPAPTPDATAEVTPEPTDDVTPDPTTEPTDEPTEEPTPEPTPLLVDLEEEGDSGKSGTAALWQDGADLIVHIDLAPAEEDDNHPAHIHAGSCAEPGPVTHPLANVVLGTSDTTLTDVSLADVADGGHYINVHLSDEDIATTVACGDIPELVPMRRAPGRAPWSWLRNLLGR